MNKKMTEQRSVEEVASDIVEFYLHKSLQENETMFKGLEDAIAKALTAERKRAEEAEKEVMISKGILNMAIFRPNSPLDALSYNELQDRLALAEKVVEVAKNHSIRCARSKSLEEVLESYEAKKGE